MVDRRVVWACSEDADYHEAIECAVDAAGRSPAAAFLDELAAGRWAEDPDHRPPRDDEQLHDYAQLLIKIEFVGKYGQPDRRTAVNHLHDGVWEFKHGARRLAYWDTPGDRTWSAKAKITDLAERDGPLPTESEVPGGAFFWYPEMDAFLRLGCAWPKQGEKAPEDKIAEAVVLRREDCAHDA